MKQIFAFAAISATLMMGCKKEATTSSNSESSTGVTYELTTSDRTADLGRTNSTVTWTGGYASVSEIKFDAKGDNRLEYKSRVPQTIDLFNALSTLGGLTIPAGTYNKVKIKIQFEPTSNASALELRGNYTSDSGIVVPVILQINKEFELKYDIKQPFTITDTTGYTISNTLPLNSLLSGLSDAMIARATRNSNGEIVISSTSNTALYNPIWDALQSILKVHIKKKK